MRKIDEVLADSISSSFESESLESSTLKKENSTPLHRRNSLHSKASDYKQKNFLEGLLTDPFPHLSSVPENKKLDQNHVLKSTKKESDLFSNLPQLSFN